MTVPRPEDAEPAVLRHRACAEEARHSPPVRGECLPVVAARIIERGLSLAGVVHDRLPTIHIPRQLAPFSLMIAARRCPEWAATCPSIMRVSARAGQEKARTAPF